MDKGCPGSAPIQKQILEDYFVEQPVGTCIIAPTDPAAHPVVAHVLTMRVPMNIQGMDHVYRAVWASLATISYHNVRCSGPMRTTVRFPSVLMGTVP